MLAVEGGVIFFADRAALLDDGGALQWMGILRQPRAMQVPLAAAQDFVRELLGLPQLPRMDLPEELAVSTVRVAPAPQLHVRAPRPQEVRSDRLRAQLWFDYDGALVPADQQPQRMLAQPSQRRLIIRDLLAENVAMRRLHQLGLRLGPADPQGAIEFWFHQRHLAHVVRSLVQEGWHVEADGRVYRQTSKVRLQVASGIDWFELRGEIDFGGQTAHLPELLRAIRRGESIIQLGDGTFGMLPEDWLSRHALIAAMGEEEGDHLKFSKAQAGLLDAMLLAAPEATFDEAFGKVRQQLHSFEGVAALDAPSTFVGELREYQRDGLGWLNFLRQFSFGGCLADDMGLGKTIQVLALLEMRRLARKNEPASVAGPSLVVVPRSIVFNWQAEAARFTPQLRVLDHTGIDRLRGTDHLADFDMILTTYGTLRRDVPFLKDIAFDYIVLDEAQAIKNPASESAKAIRLLRGDNRLALSGTPVQNHLGDLWSLLEFLNPGMLGAASIFNQNSSLRNPDPDTRNFSPARCVRSSSAAPSSRWRPTCRRASSRPSIASSRMSSASFMTS